MPYFSFEDGSLHAPDGPITQETLDAIWGSPVFPTTGILWVDYGRLFVTAFDGGVVYDLGPVEEGVKRPTVR